MRWSGGGDARLEPGGAGPGRGVDGPGRARPAPTPRRAWPSASSSTPGRWSPSRCSPSPRSRSASASTRTAVGVWSQTTVDIREWVLEPGWEHLDDVMIEASVRAGRHAQAERELDGPRGQGAAHRPHLGARRRRPLPGPAGRPRRDRRALPARAATGTTRAPLPFARARTELCYGERLRRARRRVDAREQLARASATFHALGRHDLGPARRARARRRRLQPPDARRAVAVGGADGGRDPGGPGHPRGRDLRRGGAALCS